MKEIKKKITGYKVKTEEVTKPVEVDNSPKEITMGEHIQRPEMLFGATYKIKPMGAEHALYVTINNVEIENIRDGKRVIKQYPYEIFLNSKNMEHFQWIISLMLVASACFRKGIDAKILINELKEVFDPKGGYRKKGGVWMPSLVAEIGYVIETHILSLKEVIEDVSTD